MYNKEHSYRHYYTIESIVISLSEKQILLYNKEHNNRYYYIIENTIISFQKSGHNCITESTFINTIVQ